MENHDHTEHTPEEQTTAPGSDLSAAMSSLGSADRLVAIGAALVVADYLLFELILDKYGFFTGTLLAAAYALFAIWVRQSRPSASWPLPYEWTLRVLGHTVGFLGLIELLFDLRNQVLDDPTDLIAGLVLYVGALVMFLGARQLKAPTRA